MHQQMKIIFMQLQNVVFQIVLMKQLLLIIQRIIPQDGIVGSSHSYTNIDIINCTNNGIVNSTISAGGIIGTTRNR